MSRTAPAATTARDDPPRALLPTFTPPPEAPEDPSPADPSQPPSPADPSPRPADLPLTPAEAARLRQRFGEFPEPSTRGEGTRTQTSSASSEVSLAEATGLVIGLLGVVVTVAGAIVRWQAKRRLREPTQTERRNIATPLARIARRHVDMSVFGEDTGDLLQFAAATGAYVGAGPLLQPLDRVDPNVPADINQPEES